MKQSSLLSFQCTGMPYTWKSELLKLVQQLHRLFEEWILHYYFWNALEKWGFAVQIFHIRFPVQDTKNSRERSTVQHVIFQLELGKMQVSELFALSKSLLYSTLLLLLWPGLIAENCFWCSMLCFTLYGANPVGVYFYVRSCMQPQVI